MYPNRSRSYRGSVNVISIQQPAHGALNKFESSDVWLQELWNDLNNVDDRVEPLHSPEFAAYCNEVVAALVL